MPHASSPMCDMVCKGWQVVGALTPATRLSHQPRHPARLLPWTLPVLPTALAVPVDRVSIGCYAAHVASLDLGERLSLVVEVLAHLESAIALRWAFAALGTSAEHFAHTPFFPHA